MVPPIVATSPGSNMNIGVTTIAAFNPPCIASGVTLDAVMKNTAVRMMESIIAACILRYILGYRSFDLSSAYS